MAAPFTLTIDDPVMSCAIVTNSALNDSDPLIASLLAALANLNAVAPIASVAYSSLVTVITMKDGRVFTETVRTGPPVTVNVSSTDYWALAELNLLRLLGVAVNSLLVDQLVSITLTYN